MAVSSLAASVVVAQHLGKLHPFEQLIVVVVAFAPFLVLGVVVRAARRRAIAEEGAGEPARFDEPEPPARPRN